MSFTRRSAPALLTLALGASALAGCASHAPGGPVTVAVVVGERSNSVPIDASSLPSNLVEGWVAEGATVSFISADGEPAETTTTDLAAKGPNGLYQQMSAQVEVHDGTTDLLRTRATVPEADTLGAIVLAGRALSEHSGIRKIVVIDSGLDTVAPLAFQDGVLTDSPDQVVEFLRGTDELPALRGVQVTWYGLGQVSAPQAPLTTPAFEHLVAIWRAVLHASGAARADIVTAPLPVGRALTGLPRVSTVPVTPAGSIGGDGPSKAVVVPLSAQSVNFVPGEARYVDPARAGAVIGSLAHEITSGGYHHVQIIGTAALPGWQQLSQERADTVMATLVTEGVPANEITAEGVDEDFTGFVPDLSPSGVLEPVEAEEDRLVIVTASR